MRSASTIRAARDARGGAGEREFINLAISPPVRLVLRGVEVQGHRTGKLAPDPWAPQHHAARPGGRRRQSDFVQKADAASGARRMHEADRGASGDPLLLSGAIGQGPKITVGGRMEGDDG